MSLPSPAAAYAADIDAVADEFSSFLVCNGVNIQGMKGSLGSSGNPELRGIMPERDCRFIASREQFTKGLPEYGQIVSLDGRRMQVSKVLETPDNAQVNIDLERVGA